MAAFDASEGVISPGGVGFDINCLARGSRVLSGFGYTKEIQDFEADFTETDIPHPAYQLKAQQCQQSVISFDALQKRFSPQIMLYFMKKRHTGTLFHLRTRLGYAVQATADHPILTKKGMIPAGHLTQGQEIAVYPFEGVPYEAAPHTTIIEDETLFTKQENEILERAGLLPLYLDNEKMPILIRLFGYLLGDGSIYLSGKKGFVCAYGAEEDLKEIQRDIVSLGFSANISSRERSHHIPTRYGTVEFTSRNYELHANSKALAKLFFALGYPQGAKTAVDYLVPEWLMASSLWMKRLFLSGFFGAELSKPSTHTKTGFYCPTISLNKNSAYIKNARTFCIQIMGLLEEFGVATHQLQERADFHNRFGKTKRLKLLISAEEDNLLRLWGRIGFSYNKKRELLSHIAILYIKEKKLLTQKRRETAARAKELRKKGLTLAEAKKLLVTPYTNERFITRHYYERVGHRITIDFASFRGYSQEKLQQYAECGVLFDTIDAIQKKPYDDYVYDFNIPETHNFIADNVVVSNCGMRLVTTNLTFAEVQPRLREVVDTLFKTVPAGVGSKGFLQIAVPEFKKVMEEGVRWAVDNGYGWEDDLKNTEGYGKIEWADASKVSDKAVTRGINQLGTLGSGNHYLEVQVAHATNIFDEKYAKACGITTPDQVVIMVHCGSRGFGHQVGTDYLKIFDDAMRRYGITVPDRELSCAPFSSREGQDYYGAMACAANMAFTNRQVIMHRIREAFSKVFARSAEELEMNLVYDVAHNIAKLEKYKIDGSWKELVVHRKGSTRAFGPGNKELSSRYQEIGQPVIIGGSMETGSYLLVGTKQAEEETFGSTAHGSGRTMSRAQAKREVRGEQLQKAMEKKGIYVKAVSMPGLAEEAGLAYKDVDEVIDTLHQAGISRRVAKLAPVGNVKG